MFPENLQRFLARAFKSPVGCYASRITAASKPTRRVTAQATPTFIDAAAQAIREAQDAMTGLIGDAGLGGARAVDLARTLDLDKTLAWKLARFTVNEDPCDAFKHLPGRGGVEIVVEAAKGVGVAADQLARVRAADQSLRGFVRKHAGDRRTFEAMLAGVRPDPVTELEERRSYYKAGSAIWGVRAQTQFLTLALFPSDDQPDQLDCVQVSGYVQLERLRPQVPWLIRRLRTQQDDGTPYEPFKREALDPRGASERTDDERPLSLMTDYCSRPLPEIRQWVGDKGWLYDELAPGDVGRAGAVTVIAGERYRNALPRYRSTDNVEGRYVLTVRTPLEHVQFDLLLHPDLTHFRWPTFALFGNLEERGASDPASKRELEPVRPADAVQLNRERSASFGFDYGQLLSDAFTRAGCGDVAGFRHFRGAVDYPPAPCELQLTCELAGT
ncbi:MAG: hypothetical protein AAGD32_08600 [Planctomycetota bacterium]